MSASGLGWALAIFLIFLAIPIFLLQRRRFGEQQRALQALTKSLNDQTTENEALNKELEHFSHTISHDLSAPLRAIEGFSRALTEDYYGKMDAEGRDYLERIQRNTRQMGEMIEALLKLSRVSATKLSPQKVDLSAIAAEIIAKLQENCPQRQINARIEPNLQVMGDAKLLRTAIENLLENAWKFTSTRAISELEFGQFLESNNQVFFISDNGIGFNMKHAARLFGALQRLDGSENFPGTGIGLAITQRIIHKHGGILWAEAELDQGATFYFTLEREEKNSAKSDRFKN